LSGRLARFARVVVPSVVAGIFVELSVPPVGLWELAFVGLGLLAWRLAGLTWKARLLAGLSFGIGLFAFTLIWVTGFSLPGYVVLVVFEAGYFAVACALVPSGRGLGLPATLGSPAVLGLPTVLGFPAAMTLAEAARSAWPFGGLPMGGIPLGQAGGPLLATARVGGPLLVTGLTALGGVCLACLLVKFARRRRAPVPSHPGWVALAAAVVVVGSVAGSATLASDGGPSVGAVRVALVQGGGIRGLRAVNVNPEIGYVRALRETLRLKPPVSLILWPEDIVALPGPLAGTVADEQLGSLAETFDATLVAGVTEDVGATRFLNLAVAWSPAGRVIGNYDKVHRVPFGEYVPFRSSLRHLVNLSDVPRDAIAGHGPGLLATPAGPLGVMISYEVFFAGRARAAVTAGGQLLVVPTNTSSYVSDLVPAEEEAADRLRAVEEGRDLVQASPTGYSTVVSNRGVVRDRSGLGVAAVVEATVHRRVGLTLYERGGKSPVLALAVACLVVGWAWGWYRRGFEPAVAPSVSGRRDISRRPDTE
jgi:apolipoprotein N-acyltransferase